MRILARPEKHDYQGPPTGKVVQVRGRDVIIEDSAAKNLPARRSPELPARCYRFLQRRWDQTSTITKVDAGSVVVISVGAEWAATTISPFFMFGLTLVLRLFYFLFYALRIEIGRFEAKVAARTLAYINLVALVTIIVVVIQSDAMWKYQAFAFLVFALVMEVIGVLTWWTKWAANSELWNNGNGGLRRVFEPRNGYLLFAFGFLLTEYIAYGLEWNQYIDDFILFIVRIPWWVYHIIDLIVRVFHH